MSDDALFQAGEQARRSWLAGRDSLGRICAFLHDHRDFTWQQIADRYGVDVTTARRWALPHLRD